MLYQSLIMNCVNGLLKDLVSCPAAPHYPAQLHLTPSCVEQQGGGVEQSTTQSGGRKGAG